MANKTQFFTNQLINILPDSRPITSLSIVEDYEKCPKNFKVLHRTFDADMDADLWREHNILFGKRTSRYLCISKTEGNPEHVIETLKVIGEKETIAGGGFSMLTRTMDTEQKAWRKRQVAYKIAQKSSVQQAVTDIILCSKSKNPPGGWISAGEINGILVCYKTDTITQNKRPAPPTPTNIISDNNSSLTNNIQQQIDRLKLYPDPKNGNPIPPPRNKRISSVEVDDEYEIISPGYQLSPKRAAPPPPQPSDKNTSQNSHIMENKDAIEYDTHTLYYASAAELLGVPFQINPVIKKDAQVLLPSFQIKKNIMELDYSFQLERQILCVTKSDKLPNPFFH
uniref:Multivesicular body subunit 12A n=1 Tax=Culicoides sonorensis TaxID=179676 RepID=A0A336LHS6_CULSO